jgi:hypothetical protein
MSLVLCCSILWRKHLEQWQDCVGKWWIILNHIIWWTPIHLHLLWVRKHAGHTFPCYDRASRLFDTSWSSTWPAYYKPKIRFEILVQSFLAAIANHKCWWSFSILASSYRFYADKGMSLIGFAIKRTNSPFSSPKCSRAVERRAGVDHSSLSKIVPHSAIQAIGRVLWWS